MKQSIILLFVLAFITGFSATCKSINRVDQQNAPDSLMIWDKLNIQSDPKINELLKQEAVQSKKNGTIGGFRLQIYFGSGEKAHTEACLLYTSPSPRDGLLSRMPSS